MKTYPSILVVDGAAKLLSLDDRLVQQSRFVAYQHPTKRHLFGLIKARTWPPRAQRRHAIEGDLMTLKTLNRYIVANLAT